MGYMGKDGREFDTKDQAAGTYMNDRQRGAASQEHYSNDPNYWRAAGDTGEAKRVQGRNFSRMAAVSANLAKQRGGRFAQSTGMTVGTPNFASQITPGASAAMGNNAGGGAGATTTTTEPQGLSGDINKLYDDQRDTLNEGWGNTEKGLQYDAARMQRQAAAVNAASGRSVGGGFGAGMGQAFLGAQRNMLGARDQLQNKLFQNEQSRTRDLITERRHEQGVIEDANQEPATNQELMDKLLNNPQANSVYNDFVSYWQSTPTNGQFGGGSSANIAMTFILAETAKGRKPTNQEIENYVRSTDPNAGQQAGVDY